MYKKGSLVYIFISIMLLITMIILILFVKDDLPDSFKFFNGKIMAKGYLYVLPGVSILIIIKELFHFFVPKYVLTFVPKTDENRDVQIGLSQFFICFLSAHGILMLTVVEIFTIAAGRGNENYNIMLMVVIALFILLLSGIVFWYLIAKKNK